MMGTLVGVFLFGIIASSEALFHPVVSPAEARFAAHAPSVRIGDPAFDGDLSTVSREGRSVLVARKSNSYGLMIARLENPNLQRFRDCLLCQGVRGKDGDSIVFFDLGRAFPGIDDIVLDNEDISTWHKGGHVSDDDLRAVGGDKLSLGEFDLASRYIPQPPIDTQQNAGENGRDESSGGADEGCEGTERAGIILRVDTVGFVIVAYFILMLVAMFVFTGVVIYDTFFRRTSYYPPDAGKRY